MWRVQIERLSVSHDVCGSVKMDRSLFKEETSEIMRGFSDPKMSYIDDIECDSL